MDVKKMGIRLALVGTLLLASGCPTMTQAPVISPPKETPFDVDLLARAFLPRNERSAPDYAYYGYLLFTDKTNASLPARSAACRAYLQIFEDVVEVTSVNRPGTDQPAKREELAIIYAPVKTPAAAARLRHGGSVDECLGAYDYVTANYWMKASEETGARIPKVAIIGAEQPIDDGRPLGDRDVYVVNLDVAEPSAIEQRVQDLATMLKHADQAPTNNWLEIARDKALGFFERFGQTLRDLADATS